MQTHMGYAHARGMRYWCERLTPSPAVASNAYPTGLLQTGCPLWQMNKRVSFLAPARYCILLLVRSAISHSMAISHSETEFVPSWELYVWASHQWSGLFVRLHLFLRHSTLIRPPAPVDCSHFTAVLVTLHDDRWRLTTPFIL